MKDHIKSIDQGAEFLDRQADKLDPFAWTKNFTLTDEEAAMIAEPKWVFENLIIQGHVAVYPAPPNGGKTTIFNWIAGQIAEKYKVYYVNADISGGDAKQMQVQAREKGFTLMLPDMKVGLSMGDVVEKLKMMNDQNHDYSSEVFIFDTLKKMTNVIQKEQAKTLYKILRGLSAKGMTIILLGHTNKYNDAADNLVYEGTGDLRSDVDELIYLIPKKNDDGSMTVSTEPDKVRGTFKPMTFNITAERQVSLADDYVDVIGAMEREKRLKDDELLINAIKEAIQEQKFKQVEIVAHCKSLGIGAGEKTITKVLDRYSTPPNKLWYMERSLQNNAKQYFLVTVPAT